jgi:hypothetical protein
MMQGKYNVSMPADEHPFDALKNRFESEDRGISPVTKIVADVLSPLSLPWPFPQFITKLKDLWITDAYDRIKLMIETCVAELRKHEEELQRLRESLSDKQSQERGEALNALLLDGARKAEATRARDRVRRIGLILANAAIANAMPDGDDVEELLRIAMELSQRDVTFLRELVKVEGPTLETQDRLARPAAYQMWERCQWTTRMDGELDSVFSKLESYGLVSRIAPPNNLNIHADFQTRFALLKKGLRFVQFIKTGNDWC